MDIRLMNILDNPVLNVQSNKVNDYNLGQEKLAVLRSKIRELLEIDFNDPIYQAWYPLIKSYLTSGTNPDLAREFMSDLSKKSNVTKISKNEYSEMFQDIISLNRSNNTDIFIECYYSEVNTFCDTIAEFFIRHRKTLLKKLYNIDMAKSVMDELCEIDDTNIDWNKGICVIDLYRHCQVNNIEEVFARYKNILEFITTTWDNIFIREFRNVMDFLGDKVEVYNWYSEEILNVISGMYRDMICGDKLTTKKLAKITYSLPQNIATKLTLFINESPVVYDESYPLEYVFDIIYQIFFSKEELNAVNNYKALCVPPSYFSKMCEVLYEFYWLVKDNLLCDRLHTKKVIEVQSGNDRNVSVEEYMDDLYQRGFPLI